MKRNIKFECITQFLSFFEVKYNDVDIEKLLKGELNKINLYSVYNDEIGSIYKQDDKLFIRTSYRNNRISAIASLNENKLYDFKYKIKNVNNHNNFLIGNCEFKKVINKTNKPLLIKNKAEIYEDNKFIGNATFDTIKNVFKTFNHILKRQVLYQNNNFSFYIPGRRLSIKNDKGDITYNVSYDEPEKSVYGYSRCEMDYLNDDYSKCDEEFRRIVDEQDMDYESFLRIQKAFFNYFGDNLFEDFAISTLKNLDEKQLKSLIDINTYSDSKKEIKKNSKKLKYQ